MPDNIQKIHRYRRFANIEICKYRNFRDVEKFVGTVTDGMQGGAWYNTTVKQVCSQTGANIIPVCTLS